MSFHVSACSLQADDIESPGEPLSVADAYVIGSPCGQMFGRNQIERASELDALPRLGLNHGQAGRIHLQQTAIPRHDLDAFRAGLRNGAQHFSFIQRAVSRNLPIPLLPAHRFEHRSSPPNRLREFTPLLVERLLGPAWRPS